MAGKPDDNTPCSAHLARRAVELAAARLARASEYSAITDWMSVSQAGRIAWPRLFAGRFAGFDNEHDKMVLAKGSADQLRVHQDRNEQAEWTIDWLKKRGLIESNGLVRQSRLDVELAEYTAPDPINRNHSKRSVRRDATRPDIIESLKILTLSDTWGDSQVKQRCRLVERHLEKPKGWCKPRTLGRAIIDYQRLLKG
jgi:hypothetical protein